MQFASNLRSHLRRLHKSHNVARSYAPFVVTLAHLTRVTSRRPRETHRMDYPGYTRLALHTPAHAELANVVTLAIL